MALEIKHDREAGKFYATVDGSEARLSYDRKGEGTLDYRSTYVPESARGRGIGGDLVRHSLDYAREHGFKVIPTCPFVESWIDEHPDYRDLTA